MATNTNNSTPQVSSKSPTIRRILREAAEISNSPSPDYTAEPLETDLFEWHFTLRGPPNSVYGEGIYHGRIVLPPTYPLRPPSFRFTTPNGRFEANREICLSISGHHEETWQPAWGIRTAIVALRSFMETDARGQLGGLDTTEEVRRRLARESRTFRCSTCARSNADIISETERQSEESSSPAKNDVKVPTELSMGWRDEMESRQQDDGRESRALDRSQVPEDPDSDSAELAEGFVQTVPVNRGSAELPQMTSIPEERGSSSSGGPTASRVSSSRDIDRTSTQVSQQGQRRPATMGSRGDGVPLWIDRAIVALVIVLAALLLKVLFGI
ncbi:ubiquitin-activating enzyme E2 family protein [Metarhizium robertsii]|uniref:Ubiquitin-conjugating enzyme n=2 Tax=Metarhizium robertsii TaxID=568076 RepID=E9F3S9_METRA|nr:ubiquitin-conjugating enzyme [Metarhizium robertsii ARSEF 23]EFY97615.1 ubiquitin-conjugating enzyme [Metarhizium robertsii ARSEF 23]EXV05102.1 ubiquitin-activating enzyme E2 family protein [Metarhizium robertsii]